MDPNKREGFLKTLSQSVTDRQWGITPTDEIHGLEKEYEGEEIPIRSVIQMVECPELAVLYGELNILFPELELEVPPAHITLATQGNPQGIAVSTMSELQQVGKRLA